MNRMGSTAGGSVETNELSKFLTAIRDDIRLRILNALCQADRNVNELTDILKARQPVVSHHLSILRMHNLVSVLRNGRQRFYRLNTQHPYVKYRDCLAKVLRSLKMS
jgi:DNA-binding transcriptional ArsR family regulator